MLTPRDLALGPGGRVWVAGAFGVIGWSTGGPTPAGIGPGAPAGAELRAVAAVPEAVWAGRSDGAVCRDEPNGGPPAATHRAFDAAVSAVAASSAAGVLVAGSAAGGVKVLDLAGAAVVADLPAAHRDKVTAAAVGPGGWFVTGSRDRVVSLWDAGRQPVFSLRQARPVRRVFVSPDGRWLTAACEGERGVRRWDLLAVRGELTALGLDPGLP